MDSFEEFTICDHFKNLKRLNISNYENLIGEKVFYIKKGFGEHKILKWDSKRGEYLLELYGQKFYSNPFKIKKI